MWDPAAAKAAEEIGTSAPAETPSTEDQICEQEPPESQRAADTAIPWIGSLGLECGEQFRFILLPKPARVGIQQEPVEGFHASPLRSFGLARARSTMAPSCRISSRSTAQPSAVNA